MGAALLEPLLGHTRGVYSVACSRDGCYIVSGSANCMVRVWDAKTGLTVLGPLQGHSDGVNSVAFSPDGRHIASGSEDSTVRVWDVTIRAEANAYSQTLLPGTSMADLPDVDNSQLVWTSSLLARHINSEGWVTTADGKLFLWLPPELRQVDDSSICISTTPSRRRMVMEFSKFVHGNSWSQIHSM
ncbi:hypothetical protein FS749_011991 [Ceratobasidium sp. UAMH 11750]|nr:hypothetical protein FS749_011991 [Ceratobasidium sp. UAMH 11750]